MRKPQLWESIIVVRQLNCYGVTSLIWVNFVRQPHFCEAVTFLWGSHIIVMQPHCCEAASLLWGSLIVVRQPHCCVAAALLWGSLIVGRQIYWCEVASLRWGSVNFLGCKINVISRILRLPNKACSIEATSYILKHWGYLIETTSLRLHYWLVNFLQHLAREFPLSWFLNLLILVPQARFPCLQLFTTLLI